MRKLLIRFNPPPPNAAAPRTIFFPCLPILERVLLELEPPPPLWWEWVRSPLVLVFPPVFGAASESDGDGDDGEVIGEDSLKGERKLALALLLAVGDTDEALLCSLDSVDLGPMVIDKGRRMSMSSLLFSYSSFPRPGPGTTRDGCRPLASSFVAVFSAVLASNNASENR